MKKLLTLFIIAFISASAIAETSQKDVESKQMCLYGNVLYSPGSVIKDQSGGVLICKIVDSFQAASETGLKRGEAYWEPKVLLRNN